MGFGWPSRVGLRWRAVGPSGRGGLAFGALPAPGPRRLADDGPGLAAADSGQRARANLARPAGQASDLIDQI